MEGKNYKATKGEGSKKPGQVENKEVLVDTLTTILEVKDRFPELDDTDVEEGLNLVVKTYETRQKGLIYEHKSTVPQVTALSYRLRTVLNWRIEGGKGYDDRVSLGEVVSTLEKVITKVTSLRQKGDSPTPFLDLLAQYRGKGEGTTLELP